MPFKPLNTTKQIKKIAFVTSTLAAGGAERNIINLALFLPQNRYKTSIISLTSVNEYKAEYVDLKNIDVVTILKNKSPLLPFEKIILVPKVFLRLIKSVKSNNYDILIASHEYNTVYLTVAIAFLFGLKCIIIAGNNITEDLKQKNVILRPFHYILYWLSLRLCSQIICVSNGVIEDLKIGFGVNSNKIKVIYNGVEINKIRKVIHSKPIKKRVPTLVTFGRLVERKGFGRLINIIKYIHEKHNLKVKLTIIGSGILYSKLNAQIRRQNLSNYIFLKGAGGKNLYTFLTGADIFIFSSSYEGFGNTIIEAMSCGLPIISTDCKYGPREILAGEKKYNSTRSKLFFAPYGILTPPFSTKKSDQLTDEEITLTEAISLLLTDKKRRNYYSKKSLDRAKFFDIKKMVNRYDSVINNLL